MDIKRFLDERNVLYTELPHSCSLNAAQIAMAVHALPQQVAKTVMLHANHSFRDLAAIVPANARIDFEKVSHMIGGAEIRLATEQDVAVRCRDCEPGVRPPFGSQYGMLTLVDESLSSQEHIVIESNSRTEALQLDWVVFAPSRKFRPHDGQAREKLNSAGITAIGVERGTLAWDAAGLPVVRGKKAMSLERQVRILIGSMVLASSLLAYFVHPYWVGLSAFFGGGLIFSGITDFCGLALILARMPWNQVAEASSQATSRAEFLCGTAAVIPMDVKSLRIWSRLVGTGQTGSVD